MRRFGTTFDEIYLGAKLLLLRSAVAVFQEIRQAQASLASQGVRHTILLS